MTLDRRCGAVAVLLGAILGAPLAAVAQEGSPRVTGELTVSGSVFDNFFRVAEDSLQRTIRAGRAEGRVGIRPVAASPLRLFVEGSYVHYEELGGSPEGGVGLELYSRPHSLRLSASYQNDRPAFDLGEVVRTSDIVHLVGSYGHRVTDDWEVGVEGQFAAFRFDSVPSNDSELAEVGGSVRWRGLGYELSPEVGASVGRRSADDPDLEYDRYRLYARLVSIPADGLYLSARYRYRHREYAVADPLARNFGREDDGAQWTAAAAFEAIEGVSLELYYDRLDNDSSRPTRTYVTQFLTLGISLRP